MEIERNLNAYASMTRWFSPHLLARAAYRDAVARIFGEFADQRGIQHVADPIPTDEELKRKFCTRYDYSSEASGGAPYWVDFAADLGDGFDSTYSVAYMLAADKLYPEEVKTVGGIRAVKGLHGTEPLEHGRLLILSGDEVYPWPTHEDYDLKTFKPYAMALSEPPVDPETRRVPPASRHVFAIPGNHDWYDGLNAFDDQFCRARAGAGGLRFGDWETRQHRSSFAIKLPHNWWIWGADIQLNDLLDSGQLAYFRAVAEQMGPQDRFILCTAEPSWYALGTPAERFARQNLNGLIEAPIRRGAKLCGIFSGDWHHYSRYNESQALGNMNLITAGGAGAYIHGTYHLKRKLDFEWIGKDLEFRLDRKLEPARSAAEPEPKQTNSNACYPTKGTSYRLALSNWLFPFRNFGFCLAVGIVYWLMTWTFATLRIDFWLDVPKDAKVTRGLIQTPRALRECLDPAPQPEQMAQQKARRSIAPPTVGTDARECLLATGVPRPDGSKRFEGTGKIEEWTLQLIDFYVKEPSWSSTGFLFLKGVHLLLLGMINSVSATVFLFGIWFAFFAITQSKYPGKRGLASRMAVATLHHGTHLLFMWALYCTFVFVNDKYAEQSFISLAKYVDASRLSWLSGSTADGAQTLFFAPIPFWVSFVYPFEMVLVGGMLGGLIFGLYLMVTYIFGKVNCDWLFSSQRRDGYRCFLRMKFEPDKLTIYPIRLDAVPTRTGWRWRRNPGPREPLVEPVSPLKPRLIEGPIVIRPEEVRNIPRP